MNPMSKAPRSKRLKLEHEKMLSNFASKFNLRCYNLGIAVGGGSLFAHSPSGEAEVPGVPKVSSGEWQGLTLVHFSAQPELFLTQTYAKHPLLPLTPPKHPLHTPSVHPLSYTKRLC